MKLKTYIGIAALAAIHVHASPFEYVYIGDFFDGADPFTSPGVPGSLDKPGFTLQDRATITFVLDSSLWGELIVLNNINTSSGPYNIVELGQLLTDEFGSLLSWKIGPTQAGLKIISVGELDGSGYDWIWTDPIHHLPFEGSARVTYPAGTSRTWTVTSVPDTASTLLLLSLSLAVLLPAKRLLTV